MKVPIQDLERRRPVWQALSDLFLDTELQDHDFQYIARVLAESGYEDQELQSMLHQEVLPVCMPSLISLTGEWAVFPLDWLEDRILRNAGHVSSSPPKFMGKSSLSLIQPDWQKVMDLLPQARHISGNPYHAYPAPAQWPSTVVMLAEAFRNGEACRFALHDALLDAGHTDLAEHFRETKEHPDRCWVLTLILGKC